MNQALGEFLTELGRVEFTMLLVMDLFNEPPIEYLFDIYAPKTFGPKVDCFKAWCKPASVPNEDKPVLERIYKALDHYFLREITSFMVRLGRARSMGSRSSPIELVS